MVRFPVLVVIFSGWFEKNENNFNSIWKFVKHKLLPCKKIAYSKNRKTYPDFSVKV